MKKKAVLAVVVIAVLAVTALAVFYANSKPALPTKELVYMQLDTKGEEFALRQVEGCAREELINQWGTPDGMLSGFRGDIWEIKNLGSVIVYYSEEWTVVDLALDQNDS